MKLNLHKLFLVVVVCSLYCQSIHFGGHQYSDKHWKEVREIIDCWTSQGNWTRIASGYTYNSSSPRVENYKKIVPCITETDPNLLLASSSCYQFPEGDNVNIHWLTHKCPRPLLPLSTAVWCNLPEQFRNIYMIGDSMTTLFYFELYNQLVLGLNASDQCHEIPLINDIHKYTMQCLNSNITLSECRNDRLSLTKTYMRDVRTNFLEYPCMDQLDKLNDPVLILNRGAHYVDDDTLLNELQASLSFIFEKLPNASIIYRNTPHGHNWDDEHPIYTLFREPITPEEAERDIAIPLLRGYHYVDFARQNALVQLMLDKHYPQVLYLDFFTSTVLRADGHRDFLHYCQGSAAIVNWTKVLFNVLLLLSGHHQR